MVSTTYHSSAELLRLLVLLLAIAWPATAAEPGAPAADFALPGGRGETVRLSDQRNNVVYLDFWASWCLPCVKSFPWMNEMQQRYGGKGLRVIAINLDEKRGDADRFLARIPPLFPVAFDPRAELARAYGVKGMPSSFLIDRNGKLRVEHVGFRESSRDALESEIRRLVEQP